jgi:hypothetical protein
MAGQQDAEATMSKEVTPAGQPGPGTEIAEAEIVGQEVEPFVDENGEILLKGLAALRLRHLLAAVPVDDESGSQRIIEQLLAGDTVMDLNRPWDATSGKTLAGKLLRIDSIRQMPSQFEGGLRAFLVAEGRDMAGDKPVVMTTSALSVVVQLARCQAEGWLPAWCSVEIADKPTDKGYYPYHLRFVPPPPAGQK